MDQRAAATSWVAILVIYGIGVVAAMQVGRVAPSAVALRQELALTLTQLGWSVSLITAASAILGVAAGFWVIAKGPRRALIFGVLTLAMAVVIAAMAVSTEMLLIIRALEGLGYLTIVVAAPTLMARHASARDLHRALALWGTFFTAGLALSAMAGGWMTAALSWRSWFAGNAFLLVIGLMMAQILLPRDQHRSNVDRADLKASRRPSVASWLLALSFLGIALIALAVLSLLPTYLVERWRYTSAAAGNITALTAIASLGGSLVYGVLGNSRATMVFACLAMIGGAWPAFGMNVTPAVSIAAAALIIFANGFLVAMVFAAVPRLTQSLEAIGPANGLVAQIGSLGALAGPPLVGFVVSSQGWGVLMPLITICTLLSLGMTMGAEMMNGARSRHSHDIQEQ